MIHRVAGRCRPSTEAPPNSVDGFQATSAGLTVGRAGRGLGWLAKGAVVALMAGLAPVAAKMMTVSGPLHPEIQPGGAKFDNAPNQVRQEVSISLTREQLPAGVRPGGGAAIRAEKACNDRPGL